MEMIEASKVRKRTLWRSLYGVEVGLAFVFENGAGGCRVPRRAAERQKQLGEPDSGKAVKFT